MPDFINIDGAKLYTTAGKIYEDGWQRLTVPRIDWNVYKDITYDVGTNPYTFTYPVEDTEYKVRWNYDIEHDVWWKRTVDPYTGVSIPSIHIDEDICNEDPEMYNE